MCLQAIRCALFCLYWYMFFFVWNPPKKKTMRAENVFGAIVIGVCALVYLVDKVSDPMAASTLICWKTTSTSI